MLVRQASRRTVRSVAGCVQIRWNACQACPTLRFFKLFIWIEIFA